MGKKVYVSSSGGVDSSLSAALLVEQGYDVTGVYMKNWTQDLPGNICPWRDDLADAKRVAVQLDIPFKVYDFQKKYKQTVVDYMIKEYQAGRTPNPDIVCNQEVKFKLFLETALADGADMIATGHYARVEYGEWNMESSKLQTPRLLRAKDENKDQTYFLYRVSEQALSKTLFPLGEYTKPEVRAMAKKRGLVTAGRKESMGICFVGKVGIKDFLSQYVIPKSGDIIEKASGKVIGQHDGAIFYTIGQRHGLDVGGGLPYYVIGKNMAKNEVYVTTNLNNEAFWKSQLELAFPHWINTSPVPDKTYQARLRHRAPLLECQFDQALKKIVFKNPERTIAPGQSVVVYDKKRTVGGGIIKT